MDNLKLEAHLRELHKHLEEVCTDPHKTLPPDLDDRISLKALRGQSKKVLGSSPFQLLTCHRECKRQMANCATESAINVTSNIATRPYPSMYADHCTDRAEDV